MAYVCSWSHKNNINNNNNNNNNNMYLKFSIQSRKYLYNIKHIKQYTNSIYKNIITKYMTSIHQNNLGTKLFLSQI